MIQAINKEKKNTVSKPVNLKLLQEMKRLLAKKNEIKDLTKDQQIEAEKLFDDLSVSQDEENHSSQQSQSQQVREEQSQSLEQVNKQKGQKQEKIQSILKNKQKHKQKDENRRQVTFVLKQKTQQKQQQDYVLNDSSRKWKEKLSSQRKGRFDPVEKRKLMQSLSQQLNVLNISYDEMIKALTQEDQKIPRNLQFWTKVCSVLPDRSLLSTYKYLKRQLNPKNKGGEWTQDEIVNLQHLIKTFGNKWSKIAKQMHRTPENIRDKYRAMVQERLDPSKEQTVWKFQELVLFLRYLQKYTKIYFLDEKLSQEIEHSSKHDQEELLEMKRKKYNSKNFQFHNNLTVRKYIGKQFCTINQQNVPWQKICDKLKTKTVFDLRNKFIQLIQLQLNGAGLKEKVEPKIVKFIKNQRPKQQSDIKWSQWKHDEVSSEQAKNIWVIMKRHVIGRGQKQFGQILSLLESRF